MTYLWIERVHDYWHALLSGHDAQASMRTKHTTAWLSLNPVLIETYIKYASTGISDGTVLRKSKTYWLRLSANIYLDYLLKS